MRNVGKGESRVVRERKYEKVKNSSEMMEESEGEVKT